MSSKANVGKSLLIARLISSHAVAAQVNGQQSWSDAYEAYRLAWCKWKGCSE